MVMFTNKVFTFLFINFFFCFTALFGHVLLNPCVKGTTVKCPARKPGRRFRACSLLKMRSDMNKINKLWQKIDSYMVSHVL